MKLSAIRRILLIGAAMTASVASAAGLPPLPEGLTAPAKATQMPAFNLPKADGATVRSESLADKVVIARFWATW